jgi:ABC-type multidrug transport system ATPase subunit
VLLLDEPASGLDPEARIHLRTLLRGLAADGRTILVSSHILSELDELADDAVFMVQGETVSGERVAAASTRAREWRIRIPDLDPEEGRIAVAAALPDAPSRLDRRDVVVPFASEADAVRALGALVAAGVGVSEFAPLTGDLEHTFLDLGAIADTVADEGDQS